MPWQVYSQVSPENEVLFPSFSRKLQFAQKVNIAGSKTLSYPIYIICPRLPKGGRDVSLLWDAFPQHHALAMDVDGTDGTARLMGPKKGYARGGRPTTRRGSRPFAGGAMRPIHHLA